MGTNNMKDNHEEITDDVYSAIRSAEVRDYLRNEEELNIFEEAEIIYHSYIPMRQKLTMLKQLSTTGSEEEAGQINEVYDILSEYMNQIYHPSVKTTFFLEIDWPNLEDGFIRWKGEYVNQYNTVDELIELMEAYSEDGTGMRLYGNVSVAQAPQIEKLRYPFGFTLFWIDGKWQIKDIDTYKWDALSMLDAGKPRRYPLPFEDGSRLKLLLPFMEEPFYGILSSENSCGWYHYLYDEKDTERKDHAKSIDLSYANIGLISRYSSLDWVERT